MSSIELVRIGIILSMISIIFISPEVFLKTRNINWLNRLFIFLEKTFKKFKSSTNIALSNEPYNSDVIQQLKLAFEGGKPTKLLLRVTFAHITPLISLIILIQYFHGNIHIALGIIAGIVTAIVLFFCICDVFYSHNLFKSEGIKISFAENIAQHILFPPIIYLHISLSGIIWFIAIIFILINYKYVKAWLAAIGIIMFFTGQIFQLLATYI